MQATQSTPMIPFTIEGISQGMLSHPDSPDLYRIRIQPADAGNGGPTIKYLTGPNTSRLFTGLNAHALRRKNLAFDKVPAGDWVVGRLVPAEEGTNGQGGKLELASTETDTAEALDDLGLRNAEPVFCGTTVDLQDCLNRVDGEPWTKAVLEDGREVGIPNPTELQCMDYVSATIVVTPPGVPTDGEEVICVAD